MPDTVRHRAIITGASSGLGEEFAVQLAPYMDEIIIVARRKDRLTLVKEAMLKENADLAVTVIVADLTDGEELQRLIDLVLSLPPMRTLLVNNAGLGDYGDFLTAEWNKIETMLVLNIATLTKLTHSLLPMLIERNGGIINVSSLASSLPIPDFAVYAATKSYVLSFSEALRLELKKTGVNVLAVCPGPVTTEFGKVARRSGFTGNMVPGGHFFDTPKEVVVADALRGLSHNKARLYPGLKIRLASMLLALMPMPLIRLVMGRRPRQSVALPDNPS